VALGGEGCHLHRSYAGRSNEPPRALGVYVRKGAAQPLPSRQETAHGHKYFEVLSLCILQAGLSWASVRRSWPRYRSAFLDFEIAKLAHATPAALLRRPGALRTGRRSRPLLRMRRSSRRIRAEHGTFARYLARSNRIRMRARFCRSASGTWVRTPRSSTCTAGAVRIRFLNVAA